MADLGVDWQRREHLGLCVAQHAGSAFGAVADGQVRYHVGELAAKGRILREGSVHGGRQCLEWGDGFGRQPEDLVIEPIGVGEPAVEAGHGRHGGRCLGDYGCCDLLRRHERVQNRHVSGDSAVGRPVEPDPQMPDHGLGLGDRNEDRAFPQA